MEQFGGLRHSLRFDLYVAPVMAPRMRTSQRINTAVFVPKMRAWLAVGGRTEDDKMARWQDRKMVEVRRANR